MAKYIVRAEEKKTVYGVTLFEVDAPSTAIAKLKILKDDPDVRIIDAWDNCTEDIEYVNEKSWEITPKEKYEI